MGNHEFFNTSIQTTYADLFFKVFYTDNYSNFDEEEPVLQPFWSYLHSNYGYILKSPLFPMFYALTIDYTWVAIFTCAF